MPNHVKLGNGLDAFAEEKGRYEEAPQMFWGEAAAEQETQKLELALRPGSHCKTTGEALTTAPVLCRVAAGLIDRLVPLPFLIPFFWPWVLVVIAYDLGRDAAGASVGKRLLGLKTVMVSPDPSLDGQACTLGRSLLRNLLWTGVRLCYLTVVLVPVGLVLDAAGCLMALLTAEGRHWGDRIGGTQVVMAATSKGGTA